MLQLQGTVEADDPMLPGQTLGTLQIKGKVGKLVCARLRMNPMVCRALEGRDDHWKPPPQGKSNMWSCIAVVNRLHYREKCKPCPSRLR